MRTIIFALALCLISCDKSNPVVPPPPPPPTITGGWDVTLVGPGGTGTALLVITDNSGSVSGTFQIGTSTSACSGTFSASGILYLGIESNDALIAINSTVNAARTTMSGTLSLYDRSTNPITLTGTLQLSAVKR